MTYLIPALAPEAHHEHSIEIEKSRFIAWLAHAPTPEGMTRLLAQAHLAHPNARHHCTAFIAGAPNEQNAIGFSDDGEPGGTAGRPMYQVLEGSGVGQVACVVIRYFGGIKLGTGGLVKAYTETVQAVLAAIERVEKIETIGVLVELGYEVYEVCKRHIEALGAQIEAEDFGAHVELILRLDEERFAELFTTLKDATSGRALIERID